MKKYEKKKCVIYLRLSAFVANSEFLMFGKNHLYGSIFWIHFDRFWCVIQACVCALKA